MRRYLSNDEIDSRLNSNKAIELFLGNIGMYEDNSVAWLSFEKGKNEIIVNVFEVFDVGGKDYADIYSFGSTGKDQDEPIFIHSFPTFLDAIKFCEVEYGADIKKVVNEGVVQDEYIDYKTNNAV